MSHTCTYPMNLFHYITDQSGANNVFNPNEYIFTHDVVYAHKDVDWYWGGDSGIKPTKVNIIWPAGVPYYDWCHYKEILGNVCILPPAMWQVVEVHPTMDNSYLAYEVTITPKVLFVKHVEDLTSAILVCDPVILTEAIYTKTPEPSQKSAGEITFDYTFNDWVGKKCRGPLSTAMLEPAGGINLKTLYTYLISKYLCIDTSELRVPFNIRPNRKEYRDYPAGYYILYPQRLVAVDPLNKMRAE